MAETLNFDNAAAGTSPDGWTLTMTGKGEPKWTVEAESDGAKQAERSQAIRTGDVSPRHQARYLHP